MDTNLKIILALLVTAVFFAGCMSPSGKAIAVGNEQQGTETVQQEQQTVTSEPEKDVSAAVNISAKSPLELDIEQRLAAAEDLKKRKSDLPDIFYQNMPPFPEDFYRLRILVIYGKITNLDLVEEKYWKQPEFIPGFEEHAVRLMKTPQTGRWGAFGYGVYPADTDVTTPADNEFTVTTFVHTSWLVETYQGVKFETVYKEKTTFPTQDLQGSSEIQQNPDAVKDYFDVSYGPDVMVLEPTYPVLESGWIQKLKVTVKVKPNTPPGRYVIGVNIGSPSAEFNDEMMMKYLNYYTTGGSNVGVGRPFYQIAVTVK